MMRRDNFLENILVKAAKIQTMGPKYVVIKKGSMELYFHNKDVFFAPALPLEVFDPTGAGDTLQEDLRVLNTKRKHLFENMKTQLFKVLT
jgi:bifunctional ADP-heptose synthase (sugar kinase/adenylyltransferase)